jgi:hypothetical protein
VNDACLRARAAKNFWRAVVKVVNFCLEASVSRQSLRLVQFQFPQKGRRVGLVDGKSVADLTSAYPKIVTVHDLFFRASSEAVSLTSFLESLPLGKLEPLAYHPLLNAQPGGRDPWLLPPLDHLDPAHCLISGTGLTHLGSAAQRDQMHLADPAMTTDSQKMFAMGQRGGKPGSGRGVQPEWFYKGNGLMLKGHNDFLEVPEFAEDGGEEPEIAGCYVVDRTGIPCRLGFTVGNEWSDHALEKGNYLWLAPSKLRTCSIGPELVVTESFRDLRGRARIFRGARLIYDSGAIATGEENMCHSLANLEDHHFKNSQFRYPGDVHIHFFGTSRLSFGQCEPLSDGDRVEIEFEGMGPPLVNFVRRLPRSQEPVRVRCPA